MKKYILVGLLIILIIMLGIAVLFHLYPPNDILPQTANCITCETDKLQLIQECKQYSRTMIPINRILHQIWFQFPDKSDDFRSKYDIYIKSCKRHTKKWKYYLWTEEACRQLVIDYFPEFLETYDNFRHPIFKVDSVKYIILYVYGGLYIDMDTYCLKNFDNLLTYKNIALSLFDQQKDNVCNDFMYSVQTKNPFWKYCIKEIMASNSLSNNVIYVTGPRMISRIYRLFKDEMDISLIESKYLKPDRVYDVPIDCNFKSITNDEQVKTCIQNNTNAYMFSPYSGSWMDKTHGFYALTEYIRNLIF